MTQITQIKKI